jgi:hypothetical protein
VVFTSYERIRNTTPPVTGPDRHLVEPPMSTVFTMIIDDLM